MADKAVSELIEAERITSTDLFVLEQNGTAKKLTGQVLLNWLTSAADGHGGIKSIQKASTSGLTDTYRITLADTTTFDFVVTNGKSVENIQKTGTSGLVDTYTIYYAGGLTSTFTVTNGAKGDKGDNQYVWIKYASQQPTAISHSFGDVPDNWIGIYSGSSATAPTDWQQYKWFQIKGEKGDTGAAATVRSNVVEYQVSDSGTIIPSGAWVTSIPVVAQGRYLWTRTTTTFNTGSSAVSYSVSRMGLDGTGSVSSVANISPDANGNVPLTAADIGAVPSAGGAMTGELNMNGQPISGLNAPTANDHAANMGYVNAQVKKAAPRNLLGNSDWRDRSRIVNQRGKTTYNDDTTIDRWSIWHDGNGASLTINDGHIAVSFGNNGTFNQRLPKGVLDPTETYTLVVKHKGEDFPRISYGRVYFDSNYDYVTVLSGSGELEYAALYEGEYTEETLPEYQPKGYDAELLACQTQLQRFRTESERKTYCEDFRPTMRMAPNGMASKFEQEIDGVTYYFASAEL